VILRQIVSKALNPFFRDGITLDSEFRVWNVVGRINIKLSRYPVNTGARAFEHIFIIKYAVIELI
jgi:hypothetical protein